MIQTYLPNGLSLEMLGQIPYEMMVTIIKSWPVEQQTMLVDEVIQQFGTTPAEINGAKPDSLAIALSLFDNSFSTLTDEEVKALIEEERWKKYGVVA